MPIRKVGSEMPISETVRKSLRQPASRGGCRCRRPSECRARWRTAPPRARARASPAAARRSCRAPAASAGRRCRNRTGPRSHTKRPNWTGTGSLRPSCSRSFSAVLERGVLPDHLVDRIADEAEQHEGEQRHREHDEDRLEQAADERRPASDRYVDWQSRGVQAAPQPCGARRRHVTTVVAYSFFTQ